MFRTSLISSYSLIFVGCILPSISVISLATFFAHHLQTSIRNRRFIYARLKLLFILIITCFVTQSIPTFKQRCLNKIIRYLHRYWLHGYPLIIIYKLCTSSKTRIRSRQLHSIVRGNMVCVLILN